MLESLFYKVADPRSAVALKKWLQHICFSVDFTKFLKNTYFAEHLSAAAPTVSRNNSSSSSNQMFIYLYMHLFISQS